MIYDHCGSLLSYRGLSPLFDLALRYLERTDLAALEPGKYPIDGDAVFVLIQSPRTRSRAEGRWESHRRYIDIQSLLSGSERIGIQSNESLTVEEPYDSGRDIAFYRDNGQGFFVPMAPGNFVVCFPQDAHMPLVCADAPEQIKKAVIKIRIPEGKS